MTEDSNTALAADAGATGQAVTSAVEPTPAPTPAPEPVEPPSAEPGPVPTVTEIQEVALRDAMDELRTAQMHAAVARGHILAGDGTRCQRCGAAEWAALEGAPCEPNTEITHGEVDSQAEEQAAA